MVQQVPATAHFAAGLRRTEEHRRVVLADVGHGAGGADQVGLLLDGPAEQEVESVARILTADAPLSASLGGIAEKFGAPVILRVP